MATVKLSPEQNRNASFALYRTRIAGDERVVVRRMVAPRSFTQHSNSIPLARQRARLATASQHWNNLTPSQKNTWRHKLGYVSRQGSPSEQVLLSGRQLFISQEISSLNSTGQQLKPGYELCIVLCNEDYEALLGMLTVSYLENNVWNVCQAEQIAPGNWRFPDVPRAKQSYRIEGQVSNYTDPKLQRDQFATEDYLRSKHYHVLFGALHIQLINQQGQWLPGIIHVYYYENGVFTEVPGVAKPKGSWLFPTLPAGKEYYKVEGELLNYYDPKNPADQQATYEYLLSKKTHTLYGPLGQEVTINIYSDPGSGGVSCDARVQRFGPGTSWQNIHDGPGTQAYPGIVELRAEIFSYNQQGLYTELVRSIMTYLIRGMPPYSKPTSLKFLLWGTQKQDTRGQNPALCVFSSYPLASNNIEPDDFNRLSNGPLTNVISYADFKLNGWNIFTFHQWFLDHLSIPTMLELALREYYYDAANNPPPIPQMSIMRFVGYSADWGDIDYMPHIELKYRPVL